MSIAWTDDEETVYRNIAKQMLRGTGFQPEPEPINEDKPEPPYEPEGIPFTSNAGISAMFRVLQRLEDEYRSGFWIGRKQAKTHNPDPLARGKAWGVGSIILDTRLANKVHNDK